MFLVITIRIYFSVNAMSEIWYGIGMEVWKIVFHSILEIFHSIQTRPRIEPDCDGSKAHAKTTRLHQTQHWVMKMPYLNQLYEKKKQ